MAEALCRFNPTIHVAFRMNHRRPLWKCRGGAMRVSMSDNNRAYRASIDEQVEDFLRKVVTVRDPVSVFEPMRHFVFSAPSDTAPALCVAACELVGGHREQAVAAAAALHVFHAASFTHEQLPLSDRPSLIPKPRPSIPHTFSPNMELLISDAMIPFGLELVIRSDNPAQNNSDRILRVIMEMTRAIGSQGVVNGQYSELQLQRCQSDGNEAWHVELINNTCEKKEGGLHACGAACGAILGGGNEQEIEKLRKYGLYVGMIQGTLRRWTLNKRSTRVEELRDLALKGLEGFDEAKVETISSFVEANLSHV